MKFPSRMKPAHDRLMSVPDVKKALAVLSYRTDVTFKAESQPVPADSSVLQ